MLEVRRKRDGSKFENLEDYNTYIIEEHNKKVPVNAEVFLVGDLSFSDPNPFLDRMNGRFFFIHGNHDHFLLLPRKKLIKVVTNGYLNRKFGEQKVTLCHYPMISWNCSHWGAWLIHGHHHSKTNFPGKIMNVSMEAIDYVPVSWDEVVARMDTKSANWDMIDKEYP
jgi:calcineurin-like phosphoesterase family protein